MIPPICTTKSARSGAQSAVDPCSKCGALDASGAEATIRILGRADPKSESGNVVATLPGRRDESLVINTHHDSCFTGAVEDASGIACVLALARF